MVWFSASCVGCVSRDATGDRGCCATGGSRVWFGDGCSGCSGCYPTGDGGCCSATEHTDLPTIPTGGGVGSGTEGAEVTIPTEGG
jgi:hypothetical protein